MFFQKDKVITSACKKGDVVILVSYKKNFLLLIIIFFISCNFLCGCGDEKEDANLLSPANGVGKHIFSEKPVETEPEPSPSKNMTICIDPGHGFTDTGTESEFLGQIYENDITLIMSNKLASELKAMGYNIIMTHDGQTFPKSAIDDGNDVFNPNERVSYVNGLGKKINYFVSLHCNSYDDPSVSGTRVYFYERAGALTETGYSSEGYKSADIIAKQIERDFPQATKPTAEFGDYAVIRETSVPGTLIEMGFVTNEKDAQDMLNEDWQNKFAKSVANGINSYLTNGMDNQ